MAYPQLKAFGAATLLALLAEVLNTPAAGSSSSIREHEYMDIRVVFSVQNQMSLQLDPKTIKNLKKFNKEHKICSFLFTVEHINSCATEILQ